MSFWILFRALLRYGLHSEEHLRFESSKSIVSQSKVNPEFIPVSIRKINPPPFTSSLYLSSLYFFCLAYVPARIRKNPEELRVGER